MILFAKSTTKISVHTARLYEIGVKKEIFYLVSFKMSESLFLYTNLGWSLMESLILAQDERWRRA